MKRQLKLPLIHSKWLVQYYTNSLDSQTVVFLLSLHGLGKTQPNDKKIQPGWRNSVA